MMQHVFELAQIHSGKAISRQKAAHHRKGLRIRDYKSAYLCGRYYPPNMTNKITGLPYTGPHKILDVADDRSRVLLDLPEAF